MIYTITLIPALDRNLWIEKVLMDDSNCVLKEERYAAGKGIDVSRVLKTLEIISAAQTICDKGTGIPLVSEKDQHLAVPPQVNVVNTIGAGDSAIGGFVYGQVSGRNLSEALVCAVAAGTATTLRPGPALCAKDDFQDLVPQVKIYSGDEITKYLK